MENLKPEPSQSLIVEKNSEWDKKVEYFGPEKVLQQLFTDSSFDNFDKTYSKCYFLNIVYGTRMSKEDLKQMVKFINGNKVLNDYLINGNEEAVYQIAFNSSTDKKHFSFATKYCSFTNPTQYPIYDTVVDSALWQYKKQGLIKPYKRSQLNGNSDSINRYRLFKGKIDEVISEYKLDCSYKQLDHFLWLT